jgi:hypothetical protein
MESMRREEIAKLLALDRRAMRVSHDPGDRIPGSPPNFRRMIRDCIFVRIRAEEELLQAKQALRDLLAIHDAEAESGFCWNDPARVRLEEIRALAARV